MIPRPRLKPRFTIPLSNPEHADKVMARLEKLLASERCPAMGQVLREHAYVALPREERSLLSPYLNLSVRKEDGGQLILFGRFSPHPHVWTGFMATYAAIGFVGFSCLVYGWAHTLNGDPGPIMWGFPISLALIAFVWGAGIIGQGLTADQMYVLRRVVDMAAGICENPLLDDEDERDLHQKQD